jgi:hypothetical protein
MEILLTGMSSAHTSPKVHEKNFGFFGVLNKIFTELGHSVTWTSSSMSWSTNDLKKYDAVFVGITPPTSISANRAYGALGVVESLWGSSKLHLVIDSPQQWLIQPSLKSVLANPKALVKSFYSKRAEFSLASSPEGLDRLIRACTLLSNEVWPITLHPSLPWKSDDENSNFPVGARDVAIGISYDSKLLSEASAPDKFDTREQKWLIDSKSGQWNEMVSQLVHHPIELLKESKAKTDYDALVSLVNSTGLLVAPQRRQGGTWWSYAIVQALASLTPIASDWRETMALGDCWNNLPAAIEEMSVADRYLLATEQRRTYLESVPTKEETLEIINNLLNRAKEK